MKLCFATGGWPFSLEECMNLAQEMHYDGLELSVESFSGFEKAGAPLSPAHMSETVRRLNEASLSVAAIAAHPGWSGEAVVSLVKMAHDLRVPFVVLPMEEDVDAAQEKIAPLIAFAEKYGVTLLVPTAGVYADTGVLKNLLDRFASDFLGAAWDVPCAAAAGKSAEEIVTDLGAYIGHVYLCDGIKNEKGMEKKLVGEGELNLSEVFSALRSISFDGFFSFSWQPGEGAMGDADVVLSHYAAVARDLGKDPRRPRHRLYDNKRGTGKYVWKKEALIDYTFSRLLDKMVEEFPDQYAFRYTTLDYTRTYSQFRDDVDECARAMMALGVRKGAHVAVWATNVPQWYIAFWATTKIGAVLVTVNTAYKIHEAEYLLRQSDTHTLIMVEGWRDADYAGIIQELCPELATTAPGESLHMKRLPFLRNIITVGFSMKGCLTWEEAMARANRTPREALLRRAESVQPTDVCNMQYTSGTTGFPKGVMLTHHNIVNNGKCIGDRMDLSTADRMMIQVPMFHCFGMVLAMTASMTHGASLYPLPYFSPKPALACIHQEKITAFHGVPTMFIALLEHPDFEKTDFSYMRTGIMAGSPCPISVMQDVVNKMHMSEITIVYGQTEASPGCTMSSTDDPLEVRVGTVGRALPEIECKIVNPETGEDLPDNVTGEFVARGYNIMKGYYKMPRATQSAIDKDGWLHTGDLACRTPEGNYRITGRLKDMIIRGGENIYPKEIEEFIYTHPKVSDVQVIGVPDEQYGEEIMACVILKEGQSMTEEELKAFVRDHMARHKTPRYVDFVDQFPTNAAGKILKYKMRENAVEKLKLQKANSIVTA
ncbi:MAG: AMP-dependent synthetase [Clostridiales bacterium]|nr:AMP-dependent synthetase [Clostridiales bacterium]